MKPSDASWIQNMLLLVLAQLTDGGWSAMFYLLSLLIAAVTLFEMYQEWQLRRLRGGGEGR